VSQHPLPQKVQVQVGLVVEVLFLGLDFVGLAGGMVVDLSEAVLVQLGFQGVHQTQVGWEVVRLLCLEVVEGMAFGFEVTVDNFGVDVGFVVGGNNDVLLQVIA